MDRSGEMTAIVLSGGGALGSVQAGAIEGLLAGGVRPDVLVGSSIGAANAAFLAADPTPERAAALSKLWRDTRSRDVFPVNPMRMARSLARGTPLFSREPLRRLLEAAIPYPRIEDAAVPLRIVATRYDDGEEVVFESGSVVDAILASTALPGVFGPMEIGGARYLDGGLADHVPICPAVEAGAAAVYIVAVGDGCPPPERRSVRSDLTHSLGLLLSRKARIDLEHLPEHHAALRVFRVPTPCASPTLRDLTRSRELVTVAREQAGRFLASDPLPDRLVA